MERLHIVDGSGYVYRAHYGLAMAGPGGRGVRLTTQAGEPTGALLVYAQMLVRLVTDVKPERVIVVFDARGKSFRSDIDPEYKANRKETPEDLVVQLPRFQPLTEAFGWPVISVPGVEADDVIATLVQRARAQDWEVTIFTADKDLMQLVGPHVEVIDSMRQKTYDRAAVEKKFGVGPELVADWLALVGDTSDNVPGVAGVGAKTAAKLLLEHGSIDGILASTSALKGKLKEKFEDPDQLERLAMSRRLVALVSDVELPMDLGEMVARAWDGDTLAAMFRELEFHALLERLDPKAAATSVTVPAKAPAKTEARSAVTLDAPIIASDWSQVEALIARARGTGMLGIWPFTDGDRPDRRRLVGLGLCAEGEAPLYAPLCHRYLSAPRQLDADAAPASVRAALADKGLAKLTHDAKDLQRVLGRIGLRLEGVTMDLMLAAYLVDASRDDFDIEAIAASLLGVGLRAPKDLFGTGKKAAVPESIPVEDAAAYAGGRAQVALLAAPILRQRLEGAGALPLFDDVELPLSRVLADIEDRGIRIDQAYLRELADRVGGRIAELEAAAYQLAGDAFNLGSPKQLSAILFDKLGLRGERMKKTKTGGYSTDSEVLEGLVGSHPIVALVIEHRELTKLKGTYIDALPPLVHPRTGRLHTSFRQAVAATGRLSSQDPNLQNIPIRTELGREIRRAFVASPGMKLVSADYSQIELRVLAHLSGDPVLVRAFQDDIDIHTQTAAEVFGIPLAEVGANERRVAKAVNYGLVYGQSEFGLARALDISREQARHYIERYFERFATVRAFMDEVVRRAKDSGAAETILGRRRLIPDLRSKNFRLRSAAERVAQNTPMQGSAADIMKLAMLRVEPLLEGTGAAVLLTVHDELVVESPEDRAEEAGAILVREMEAAYRLKVPLKVDVGVSANWSGAH